jgi:class 3 adenylate cyclase
MFERSKILIIAEEPLNKDLLEQGLADLGYEVVSATSGQEALAKIAIDAPHLILLDVMMPGIDGFAVCRRLRENADTQFIPIVVVSALEDRIHGIEVGADDFLTKPVNQRELLTRVETALRRKHRVDQQIDELRRVKDYFAKFVPEAVKRLVALNPEAPEFALHKQDVSVLFVDISGYSRLSEQLPLDTLTALVERYFSGFLDHIQEAGGDINETAGDGFMAIFQDADLHQHARKAVNTALTLLRITKALNQEGGGQPLSIHMGINSGVALVGSIRFEGLHSTRWTFSASGPVTNLAARLVDRAAANQILVSPETARRLGDDYRIERLGCERLKNLAAAVDISRVVGPLQLG